MWKLAWLGLRCRWTCCQALTRPASRHLLTHFHFQSHQIRIDPDALMWCPPSYPIGTGGNEVNLDRSGPLVLLQNNCLWSLIRGVWAVEC